MKFSRSLEVLAGAGALALLISGCSTSLPDETSPVESSTPVVPDYVSDWPGFSDLEYAPLTGVPFESGSLDSSALSAKIDNHPSARPQWNLSKADIVWEEQVEGGLTRYVAIWHSNIPERVGPVRSIRPMDPDIISPVGGVVTYSGGKQKYVQMMRNTPVQNAIHGYGSLGDYIYRDNSRYAPHNVQTNAQKLIKDKFSKVAAPKDQFAFSFDVEGSSAYRDGEDATQINIRYSSFSQPSYSYDAESQTYLRFQAGKADYDAEKVRLAAKNIVVLRVKITMDGNVPKTELIGSGSGFVFTGGKAIPITWSKSSKTEQVVLKDQNGVIVRLAPGTTWIHPVPTAGSISFK